MSQCRLGFRYCSVAHSFFTWLVKKQMDNMDGKQARKTGNSTTLGSLFDHGCDVMNLSLTCISVLDIMGIYGTEFYFIVCFLTFSFSIPIVEQFNQKIQNRQT